MYIVEKGAHASKSSKLKSNGSTLTPMKLHGRRQIRCELCILPCFPVEAKQLDMVVWYFLKVVWYLLYGGLIYDLWWLIFDL